MTNCNEWSGCQ